MAEARAVALAGELGRVARHVGMEGVGEALRTGTLFQPPRQIKKKPTLESLTAEPGLYSRMIHFSRDFVSAPISPWESDQLAPHLERSIAAIDIELMSVPRPGTRFRLDLSPLARRFSRSAEDGPAVEFTVESIELELLDP